jgi:hypothetical protein
MNNPSYQAIQNNLMPKIQVEGGLIEVIAGEFNGHKGAASTFSPVHLMNAKLNKGGTASLSFPAHYNTALIVIEGEVKVNGTEEVPLDHFVLMANDGEDFSITASVDSVVLVLSGEPLKEPIAAHGPFVMNTREEIMQAFQDYELGKFGVLED